MSKEKIKEMAKILCQNGFCNLEDWNGCKLQEEEYCSACIHIAESLYNADYCKQIKGEWITVGEELKNTTCSVCGHWVETPYGKTPFCPECGAKMRKEDEGEMRSVLKQAIETYGAEAQLNVAIEEFAELTKEICKHKRYMDNTKDIIEEMADCYIMLEQMQMIFGLGSTVISDAMDKKIKRLKCRLADHPTEKGGAE